MSQKNYAYVSIVCSQNYFVGLVATFLSLQRTGTSIPMYVLMPQKLSDDNQHEVDLFGKLGLRVITYEDSIKIPENLIQSNKASEARWNFTFDKLLIFGLTQFDKIIFIDSDMFVLQNLDHLFQRPHMSASCAGAAYPGNEDWIDLNSGLMVIVPRDGLPEFLVQVIPQVMSKKKILGDQDVLQCFYIDWPNRTDLHLGEKYNLFATYAEYYENHLGYSYNDNVEDERGVAILHFIGEDKPWMRHWSVLSVIKQELELAVFKTMHKRDTKAVFLEYKKLVRKAKKILQID